MERGQVTILLSPCQTGSNTGMNALKKNLLILYLCGGPRTYQGLLLISVT